MLLHQKVHYKPELQSTQKAAGSIFPASLLPKRRLNSLFSTAKKVSGRERTFFLMQNEMPHPLNHATCISLLHFRCTWPLNIFRFVISLEGREKQRWREKKKTSRQQQQIRVYSALRRRVKWRRKTRNTWWMLRNQFCCGSSSYSQSTLPWPQLRACAVSLLSDPERTMYSSGIKRKTTSANAPVSAVHKGHPPVLSW